MHAPRWRALLLLTLARVSLGVQFQSVAVASPILVRDLGLGYTDLGTLIGLYFLPGIMVALPGGALARRFGDRNLAVFGLLLMTLGGLLTALAQGFGLLATGRLLSGCGAVLLNVLGAKMVTDWFAGREIVLAMAIYVNSFPIGIGIAVLLLGTIAGALGWPAAMLAAALLAAASFVVLLFVYRPHPNDGAGGMSGAAIDARSALLAVLAGSIWGLFNGAFAVMVGFSPTFLLGLGLGPGEAGLAVTAATWLSVLTIQIGAMIAQRWENYLALMVLGALGWACCLLALALGIKPGITLAAAGLLCGFPIGVIMAMPAQALPPEHRAFGVGLFYTMLYVGHAGVPPLAGWLRDQSGSGGAAFWLSAALAAGLLPLYILFRAGLRRTATPRDRRCGIGGVSDTVKLRILKP